MNHLSKNRVIHLLTPEKGPWSGSNSWGREAFFERNGNNSQMVLKRDEYGEPTIWTVMLGIDTPFTNFGDGANCTARVFMGSGGTMQVLEADWLQGTTISFVANSFNVEAFWEGAAIGESIESSVIKATAARGGSLGSNAQKTLTRRLDGTVSENGVWNLPAGATIDDLLIPKFTRQIRLVPAGVSPSVTIPIFYSPDFTVVLRNKPLAAILNTITGDQLEQGLVVPMTAQARLLSANNNSASPINFIAVADLF